MPGLSKNLPLLSLCVALGYQPKSFQVDPELQKPRLHNEGMTKELSKEKYLATT